MAQGSIAELDTQTEIALRLGYIAFDISQEITKQSTMLGKQLYALRNALLRNAG
ncbi:MAG: four helix bundle protein [Armatimonadota bacterium]